MKLGVFGGTFNPIHLGHLRVAQEVCQTLALDKVIFVPAKLPPHKTGGELAAASERLAMVEKAIDDNPLFECSPVELERSGPSYSVHTLEHFKEKYGTDTRLKFIMGADAFAELHTWYQFERIIELADMVVMTRPPHTQLPPLPPALAGRFTPQANGYAHECGTRVELVEVTSLDISSTAIRRDLEVGRSIRYLVPEAIRETLERGN